MEYNKRIITLFRTSHMSSLPNILYFLKQGNCTNDINTSQAIFYMKIPDFTKCILGKIGYFLNGMNA